MAIEYSNVKMFAANNSDLATMMKEYSKNCQMETRKDVRAFSSHTKEDMESAINKAFSESLSKVVGFGSEKMGEGKSAIKKYADMTAVKEFANAIKDDMIDMILPDVLLTGVLPYFCEVKSAELGDSIKFDIENNALFTVSKAGYRLRNTNLQKLYRSTVTMVGTNHELTVGSDLFEILIGEASIARDVMKATLSIQAGMLYDAYDAFATTMAGLTGNLLVSNYSENSAIKLAETVTAYNQGKKAVFLGTPVALKRKELISTLCA